MVSSITDKEFEEKVLNNNKAILVDFWAEWCGPCKQLLPILEEISIDMNNIEIFKINIDENPNTPTKYGVRGIPTLILFKDGKQIATKVGALPKTSLIQWINSNI